MLLEDAAQAHGATYKGRIAGSLGDAAGFSFYPGKNLGTLGDGGAVYTKSAKIADTVRAHSNYGARQKYIHEFKGVNSRLDTLQAALLDMKLQHLNQWHRGRTYVAQRYLAEIKNPKIKLPTRNPEGVHAWHLFAVLCSDRDALKAHLDANGVSYQVHYPVAMYLHQANQDPSYQEGDFPLAEHVDSCCLNATVSQNICQVYDILLTIIESPGKQMPKVVGKYFCCRNASLIIKFFHIFPDSSAVYRK